MKLVIAEKPSVAQSIAKVIGANERGDISIRLLMRIRFYNSITRDMEKAKRWLHTKVRGSEKTGVLISKESARYKPLGIHVLQSDDDNAVHWFLEDKKDTRSSNYLEDAATEIQVQGLELDYTCLLWDADMRYENGEWQRVKMHYKTVPDGILPPKIKQYMQNSPYRKVAIKEIERKPYGFELELLSDIEILFAHEGNFLGLAD